MTHETENTDFTIPPALAAQLQAAADEQHRSAREVLRAAIEDYLRAWRPLAPANAGSPAEAAARIIARRKDVTLGEFTIKELINDGRA